MNTHIAIRTLSGEGRIKFWETEEQILTPATLYFCQDKEIERYYCPGGYWEFWWFEFAADSPLPLPPHTLLPLPHQSSEVERMSACLRLLQQVDAPALALASASFTQLLYSWYHHWESSSQETHAQHDIIHQVVDYLHEHVCDPPSVRTMAKLAHLSERQFRTAFSRVMKKPPKQYVDDLRLNRGAALLTHGSMSIAEIADYLGYSSPFHFSRAFRKYFQTPPSRYRQGDSMR